MFKKIVDVNFQHGSAKTSLQDIANIMQSLMPKVRESLANVEGDVQDDLMRKHPVGCFRVSLTIEYKRTILSHKGSATEVN